MSWTFCPHAMNLMKNLNIFKKIVKIECNDK